MPETIGQVGQTQQNSKALLDKEGKYLTFALGSEEYGLEILKVREIIGYMDITAVPQTPHHVRGVVNLRGQVIPVIDLRAKFGMPTAEVTEHTCIIVVEINQDSKNFNTGIVVDRVQEVLDIAGGDIEEAPQFGSSVNTNFILGMGKVEDSVKILLDIDEVLASTDLGDFGCKDRPAQAAPAHNASSTCAPVVSADAEHEPSGQTAEDFEQVQADQAEKSSQALSEGSENDQ